MKFYRPTFAEIDLGAIRYNLRGIRRIVGKDIKILGVVKADAYGHGMVEVARTLTGEGVEYLGVASIDEAARLREAGIKNKVLVLGAILPEEIEGVLKFDIIQTVSDIRGARFLSKYAQAENKTVTIHVKVDTGMGRLGFWHEEAVSFIKKISLFKNIIIDGIYTHFPSADEDRVFTAGQIKDFKFLIEGLRQNDVNIPVHHTSNSMALLDFKHSHMNMVRPGLILYGLYPKNKISKNLRLKPALKLKSKVVHLKAVSKGRSVSYGRTYVTKKDTTIATIPVGYGDGYSRHFSNQADVLIKGKRVPIAGRVCMDMIMADTGSLNNVKSGDEVVLIGKQGNNMITAEELAAIAKTIPYEIVCNIGRRVPRVYKRIERKH
jgi:alanine racemase